jgi:SpoVK/Ycf46/Vps4 family AAA+-type ATPase
VADGITGVIIFDEADALFGMRREVRDAHDRHANIEVAFLLQRMESFDGLAILSTNLRANIDDAFTRRLDAIIDFPAPTVELRRSLWVRCLAPPLPLADDLDLDFLAESFEMAGGNIRSASTTAAYLAAAAGTAVSMQQVIAAVEQEYRKLGRLVLEREFGLYYPLTR